MFLPNDVDQFIHVGRFGDSFIIVQKNLELDEPFNTFDVVRADFKHSKEFTDLASAKELAETILTLLGVKLYDKHSESGLRLAIEVIKEKDDEPAKLKRVKN